MISGSRRLAIGISSRFRGILPKGATALAFALALVLAFGPGPAYAVTAEDKANQVNERNGGAIYVPLPVFVIAVIDKQRVAKQVIVSLSLELFPGKRREEIEDKNRQLYDAFLFDLQGILDQHSNQVRTVNPEAIKTRLLVTSERIFGPGIVHSVLFRNAYERPMKY